MPCKHHTPIEQGEQKPYSEAHGTAAPFREQACRECGIEYLSLEGINDDKAYQCGLGTAVLDGEGKPHIVEHEGVAAHPGDLGMEAIANRILEAL